MSRGKTSPVCFREDFFPELLELNGATSEPSRTPVPEALAPGAVVGRLGRLGFRDLCIDAAWERRVPGVVDP
jgi:hypothetical protein